MRLQKAHEEQKKIWLNKVKPFLENIGYTLFDSHEFGEVPIRFGTKTFWADQIAYIITNRRKVPHLEIEIESHPSKFDIPKAESYSVQKGCPYFLITDGDTVLWYETGERQSQSKQLPNAPKPPPIPSGYILTPFADLRDLMKVMMRCHDALRGEKPMMIDAFNEMSKLLFTKLHDEITVETGVKSDYGFRVRQKEAKEDTVNRVLDLFNKAKGVYPEIFAGYPEVRIDLKPRRIYETVRLLQGYTFLSTSIEIKGSAYEFFLKSALPVGKTVGQFFTPREVVDFMIGLTKPKRNQKILDPACGPGGFLVRAIQSVWDQIDDLYRKWHLDNQREEKIKFAIDNIFGVDSYDIMVRLAKINHIMHGIDMDIHKRRIYQHNGLTSSERISDIKEGSFDLILTNPPFGDTVKEDEVLANYLFGQNRSGTLMTSQRLEILFIERCMKLLREGGRFCIILPDGILNNPSWNFERVRNFLRDYFVINAIVSLPRETFIPYGAGDLTNVVYLTKKTTNSDKQPPIFMAIAEYVGYDATGRSMPQNYLLRILEEYELFEKEEDFHANEVYALKAWNLEVKGEEAWIVNPEDLEDRLDPFYYHPIHRRS